MNVSLEPDGAVVRVGLVVFLGFQVLDLAAECMRTVPTVHAHG
jgi:hypothetical protein